MKPYLETLPAASPVEVPSRVLSLRGKMWVEMDADHQLSGHTTMGKRAGRGAEVRVCRIRFVHSLKM